MAGVAALGIPIVLLFLIAFIGGRFQTTKSVEHDLYLEALVYPIGAAFAGALGFGFGPLVRQTWQAAVLGTLGMFPMFALLSLAYEPRGPNPYRVDWLFAVLIAALIGGVAGVFIYKADVRAGSKRGRSKRVAG